MTDVEFIFVGTGVSTAIPVIGHVDGTCACVDALSNPNSRNKRNNVSVLLRNGQNNILIDCGKTFRDAYFNTLAKLEVDFLTSLLITHDHADAMSGLDDLRDLQRDSETPIPTYLSSETRSVLSKQMPWIAAACRNFGTTPETKESFDELVRTVPKIVTTRRVAQLDLMDLSEEHVQRLHVAGLEEVPFYSFPVEHGKGYMCMAYAFGRGLRQKGQSVVQGSAAQNGKEAQCVVYMSDVTAVPSETLAFLQSLEKIDVMIIDVLLGPGIDHFAHFCVDQAFELVELLEPKRALGVGMSCELEHYSGCTILAEKLAAAKAKGNCQKVEEFVLAYDGLSLNLVL